VGQQCWVLLQQEHYATWGGVSCSGNIHAPCFFADAVTNSPIIGSLDNSTVVVPRDVVGLVPSDANKVITFPLHHIVSRGGEYLFVPSIQAIRVSLGSTTRSLGL